MKLSSLLCGGSKIRTEEACTVTSYSQNDEDDLWLESGEVEPTSYEYIPPSTGEELTAPTPMVSIPQVELPTTAQTMPVFAGNFQPLPPCSVGETTWGSLVASERLTPSAALLPTREDRDKKVQECFLRQWGIPTSPLRFYNPAPNPISLNREHLSAITSETHHVAEKTDGVRYNLLLCMVDNEPTAVMIDRACHKYEVRLIADRCYFDGTLFDGELVKEEDNLLYLAFDIVSYKGINLMDRHYAERFKYLHGLLADATLQSGHDSAQLEALAREGKIVAEQGLYLRPKPSYHLKNLGALWASLKRSRHKIDGLIFIPMQQGVQMRTDWLQYKWKTEHTLDFELRAKRNPTNDWKMGLYFVEADFTVAALQTTPHDSTSDNQVLYRNACIGVVHNGKTFYFVLQYNALLNQLLAAIEQAPLPTRSFRCIVECSTEMHPPDRIICRLQRVRSDKSAPNNHYTIQQTILNMCERVTITELEQHAQ